MNKLMTVVISISSMSLSVVLAAENMPPPPGPYKSAETINIQQAPPQWREDTTMSSLERQSQSQLNEMRNIQQYRQPGVPASPAYPLRHGPIYGPSGQPPYSYAKPMQPAYPVQNRMNTYPPVWR